MTNPDLPSKQDRIRFEGQESATKLVLELALLAKRQVCIFGQDIDQILFGTKEFVNCISTLARKSHRVQIKILAHHTQINIQNGHRLIELKRRLPSSIHIRNTDSTHRDLQQTLLLIDDFAYLICPRASRHEGSASRYDRLEVREQQALFNTLWELATPDLNIRELGI
ncbi:MAG: hypothetical protein HRT92_04610 [Piscirickettsiaceae bacterium]|nr:hypothetical protein [Piscirickettsiaceae bacterium]